VAHQPLTCTVQRPERDSRDDQLRLAWRGLISGRSSEPLGRKDALVIKIVGGRGDYIKYTVIVQGQGGCYWLSHSVRDQVYNSIHFFLAIFDCSSKETPIHILLHHNAGKMCGIFACHQYARPHHPSALPFTLTMR
jgi:hypothetical protein